MTAPELSHAQRTAEPEDTELAALASDESNEHARDELARYTAQPDASDNQRTRGGPTSALGWALAALLLAGFLALFALEEAIFWNPPLTFTVGASGENGILHDWEEAPDDALLPIRFSNGTLFELEPQARARVDAVGRAGAAINLESGRAHASVVSSGFRVPGEMPWHISLGAYSLEAKAARFDIDWDPRSDELTLDLFEGTLSIEGCDGHSRTISAARGARASCKQQHWSLVARS